VPLPAALPDRRVVGRFLVGVGIVGALASIAGAVIGFRFLTQLSGALDASIGVTADAVGALRSSVEVGAGTVASVERVLDETESTTRELAVALRDAEEALTGVADLSENDIAASLTAVEDALPALIDVAGVIDRTLSRLSRLPIGPVYAPDEPFDDSLRALQREFADVPDRLREQAELIRDARDGLTTVRRGTSRVADDLRNLNTTLASSAGVLERYLATAEDADELVAGSSERLRTHLSIARVLVLVLGAAVLGGQAIPLGIGWFLLRPDAAAAFLAADAPSDVP
jgi:ABC-type transporter Mla subunit MlaD